MKLFIGLLIIALLGVSSVSAQNLGARSEENILAKSGGALLTQPMINRVVDFFEWTLDTKLSDEERAELQSEIVANWKARNCLEIAGVQNVLSLADDARRWEPGELENLRILYKTRFTKEFERNGTNKINRLILNFSARARESNNQEFFINGAVSDVKSL